MFQTTNQVGNIISSRSVLSFQPFAPTQKATSTSSVIIFRATQRDGRSRDKTWSWCWEPKQPSKVDFPTSISLEHRLYNSMFSRSILAFWISNSHPPISHDVISLCRDAIQRDQEAGLQAWRGWWEERPSCPVIRWSHVRCPRTAVKHHQKTTYNHTVLECFCSATSLFKLPHLLYSQRYGLLDAGSSTRQQLSQSRNTLGHLVPIQAMQTQNCCTEMNCFQKGASKTGWRLRMAINQTLLALAMDELNDTNKPITNQVRIIEHWWDGIGNWKA